MKVSLMVATLCGVLAAGAVELAAWRGETVSAWLPDGENVGTVPAGFDVKIGVAHGVKYAPGTKVGIKYAENPERLVAYDRIVWGSDAKGARIVQVKVSPDAKAGNYKFGDVSLRVVDRVLPPPKDWKYMLDILQHPWAVSRTAGVAPFTKEHYAAMEPFWKMLASAGQRMLTVTLVDLPWNHQCQDGYASMVKYFRKSDGTVEFDWTVFDEYVEFGKKCGIGPYISCYSICPWGYQVSWLTKDWTMKKAKAVPGTPFFKKYWTPYLKAFVAHLKEKGWLEQTFISLDERSPEDLKNTIALLREVAPELKVALAGNRSPSDFKGIKIDYFAQQLKDCITDEFMAELEGSTKSGKITMYYVCCHPQKPNTFIFSELDESFWVGIYPVMSGYDGFTRWAWNSWPTDACSDATFGHWPSGDTYFVYPDGSPSARFLWLLNGIQQAEKFNILKAEGKFDAELKTLAGKYDFRAAFNKKDGDFKPLIEETLKLLNR